MPVLTPPLSTLLLAGIALFLGAGKHLVGPMPSYLPFILH